MKLLFGLILLVLLSSASYAACFNTDPSFGSNFTYRIYSGDYYNCTSQILDLINISSSGETYVLEIAGEVNLSNSTILFADTAPTKIVINSTGHLRIFNNSVLKHFQPSFFDSNLESILIEALPGGMIELSDVEIQNSSGIFLSNTTVLSNTHIFGKKGIQSNSTLIGDEVNITVSEYSLQISDSNVSFLDSSFLGDLYLSLANASFENSEIVSRIEANDSLIHMYNSSYISYTIDNSTIFQYWPVSISIFNELSLPIYGISVIAKDNLSMQRYSDITFTDGVLYPNLLSYTINDTSVAYFSNYTIFVEDILNRVYLPQNKTLNVSSPDAKINFTLRSNKGIIQTGTDCGSTPQPFCASINPVSCGNMTAGDICDVQFVVNATDNIVSNPPLGYFGTDIFTFFLIGTSTRPEVFSSFSDNVSLVFSN